MNHVLMTLALALVLAACGTSTPTVAQADQQIRAYADTIKAGDLTAARGMELDIIAAVVIGGGSLQGGEGSVVGSVAGAMLMAVIRNGLSMKGVPNWVQDALTGAIIVAAVALDRLRHRRSGD